MKVHESTYKAKSFASVLHRNRLKNLLKFFDEYVTGSNINYADFGCSNGFVIEKLVKSNKFNFNKIVGYDHNDRLLNLACEKKIPNARFEKFDLNRINISGNNFNVVTCFETLEHVRDFKIAFQNLFNHLKENGILIVSVPNETGFVGFVKLVARSLVRKDPYKNFFTDVSFWDYSKALLMGNSIHGYRKKSKRGYSAHLGFDYLELEKFIEKNFLVTNDLKLLKKASTIFNSNLIYVLKK